MKRSMLGVILTLIVPQTAHAKVSSCFGPGLYGNKTKDGTVLTTSTIGVAHKTLPMKTLLYVRYGNKTVKVKVIDRGPFVKDRVLDLTEALAGRFGFSTCKKWGLKTVKSWKVK